MDAADLERQTPLLWGGENKKDEVEQTATSRCRLTRRCKSDVFMWVWLTVIVIAAFCFQWQLIENQVRLFGAMHCTRDPPPPPLDIDHLEEMLRAMSKEVREELMVFRNDLYNVYKYVDRVSGYDWPDEGLYNMTHRYDMYDHNMIID